MTDIRVLSLAAVLLIAGCSTGSAAESEADADSADDNGEEHRSVEAPDEEPALDEAAPPDPPAPYDREYDISEVYAGACASCHGDDGDGRSEVEETFSYATPADEWSNGPTVDGILDTLEDGIHDSAMQEFPQFKDADRVELAEYVIDLRHALMESGD